MKTWVYWARIAAIMVWRSVWLVPLLFGLWIYVACAFIAFGKDEAQRIWWNNMP